MKIAQAATTTMAASEKTHSSSGAGPVSKSKAPNHPATCSTSQGKAGHGASRGRSEKTSVNHLEVREYQ